MPRDRERAGPRPERVDEDRDAVDGREDGAHERIESQRGPERGAGKSDRQRRCPHSGAHGNRHREQSERARRRVLGCVPHRTRQIVDAEPFEGP